MELSFRTITLFSAILLTGLSAGFFYAWQVSVIPGTRKVTDLAYMETMQSINRAILNPAFFLVFFGCAILLAVSSVQHYQHKPAFWVILAAFLIYLLGTFAVTAFGNVPLNNKLDALNLSELSTEKLASFRQYYESRWNRLHLIRTVFAVLSFLISLAVAFLPSVK